VHGISRTVPGLFLACVLSLASVAPVLAYTPHIGDRAAPLAGRDIVNGGTTSLEDYLGRWVLVDFGAAIAGLA
jgi:hypothetical protein